MTKEEIKEYLKRVEELELKLVDEDKDTLQWLIFGYNQCARLLNEAEQENQQLKEEKDIQKGMIENFVEKITKAIEYIENDKYEYTPMGITNKPINKELLEILKGDNNEC